MTKETRSSVVAAVISSAIVSVFGGAIGTYVSFKLLEQRVAASENTIRMHEDMIRANKQNADEKLNQIATDVSYIRGRLEGKP